MKILRNKQIDKVIHRIVANHIMAKDAFKRAFEADNLSVKEYASAIEHLTDNTIESATILGGSEGAFRINDILKRYEEQYINKK